MEHILIGLIYLFFLYWGLELVSHLSLEVQDSLSNIYYPTIQSSSPQGLDPLAVEAIKIDAWFFETHI